MTTTIEDIKRANEDAGFYFFSPDTMRFFDGRVSAKVYAGRFFVTSERDRGVTISTGEHLAAWNGERRYTVRMLADNGSICTLGGHQQFDTLAAASAALSARLREHGPAVVHALGCTYAPYGCQGYTEGGE